MLEGNVPFFPRDEAAQAMVADELVSMGTTVDQGMWLVRRYAQLFRDWQFRELRALYCSKFRPADGIEIYSGVYIDGIPSEKQEAWKPTGAIEGRTQLQIEGQTTQPISADPDMEQLVHELAQSTNMPRRPRTVEEIKADLYRPHVSGAKE